MSEELAGQQEAQIPAAEAAAPAASVETTAPAAEGTPEVPAPAAQTEATPDGQGENQEAAPTGDNNQDGTTEVPKENAAAAEQQPQGKTDEQPQIVIADDDVEKAIAIIKETHKAGCAFLQRKMKWPFKRTVALLNVLTGKGILGPQVGTGPRKILIELPPKAEEPAKPKKPQPKPQPKANKPKIVVKQSADAKPPLSDAERKERWEANLRRVGKYTNETFISVTAAYALKHGGFNKRCKWGSALIVMVNRLAGKTLDGLKTFTRADADHIQIRLMDFNQNNPLGDNVTMWNDTNVFKNNFEQRKAVKEFFGIECSFRDMKPEDRCLTAVVDAAWPNLEEEQRGTGGTFAERFVYLSLYIINMWTGDESLRDGLFGNSFHTTPTEAWVQRQNEKFGRRNGTFRKEPDTSWIREDGTCECGQPLTKDSMGNTICSSAMCEHHYAVCGGDTPDSFRNGSRNKKPAGDRGEEIAFDPNKAPLGERTQRKENWKAKKRKDRHDEGDGEFRRDRPKKHGPRWHVNEGDDNGDHQDEGTGDGEAPAGVTVATSGADRGFGSLAGVLDGIKIPVADQKKEESNEQLPPPPDEVPVQQ